METEKRNEHLWKISKDRVNFKRHLKNYVVFNIFFWIVWYFTNDEISTNEIPWPCWSMLGWGIAIVLHYFRAYHLSDGDVEKEYKKLVKEHEQDRS